MFLYRSAPSRTRRLARRAVTLVGVTALAALSMTQASATAPSHSHSDRFKQLNLVSDQPGVAQTTDPNLVNPWGLSAGPTSPIWVSDNGTDTSTLYNGAQKGHPVGVVPLVVTIPGGSPTGQVFNSTPRFILTTGGKSGPAAFIFAGENGDITAWNPTGTATDAVRVARTDGAVYKGLALLDGRAGPRLLAANFHDNRVDVFDGRFLRVRKNQGFRSVGIPAGYAPFNVAVIGSEVFVSYAKQDADRVDDVAGAGHGFINVFDSRGHLTRQFARRGVLDSPWAMTVAPTGFGGLAGKLLVGNFGNGRVNVFDLGSESVVGVLRSRHGAPIVIDGLWGLLPGNGNAGETSDVWFSAGPDDEAHGLLGILRFAG